MDEDNSLFKDDGISPSKFFKSDAALKKIDSAKKRVKEKTSIQNTQLPLWEFNKYGIPRSMVRCSLFGTNSQISIDEKDFDDPAKVNKYKSKRVLESLPNYDIEYSGFNLNQEILDLFLNIIDLHSKKQLHIGEDSVAFTGYEILKYMSNEGSNMAGGSQYERLKFYLTLLQSGKISMTCYDKDKQKTSGYQGSLIRKYVYEFDHKLNKSVFKVWFEPEILELFKDGITFMYKTQRDKLGKKQLAKWLLAFYASHNNPFDYDIEYIHRLSGSTVKSMHKFKQKLNESVAALKDVGLKNCPELVGKKLIVPKAIPLKA